MARMARKIAADMTAVITNDLVRSGLFIPLDTSRVPVQASAGVPSFGEWKAMDAQALVVGAVGREQIDVHAARPARDDDGLRGRPPRRRRVRAGAADRGWRGGSRYEIAVRSR